MKKTIWMLIIVLLLSACGLNNTMYNAREYFKAAQQRPLTANGRPSAQAVDEYTKAIRKCGIILSEEKKSRHADEALYLMARALYYKGNSAFQAKDAFEGLIKGYPNSKYVPDAHIYLARVMREVNMDAQSEALLEQFVRNPKFIKQHPRALLVLAEYEINDEDYHRAQYWLERIIKDYRKTPEFKEAYFLFGKNYFMQNDYERSLAEFQTFTKTRGIPKEMKLEAGYYVALNKYMLRDYDVALKNTRALIRSETRPEKISALRVLYARILLAKGNADAATLEFEDLIKKYPRTEQSAEAHYHFGNYYYYEARDIDKAIQALNRVRTEFSKSPYADIGAKIATALGQMKAPANLDSRKNLQAFLDHHYLKAEYFISPLALPDSALASYQSVIDERDFLIEYADSLDFWMGEQSALIDSISVLPEVILAEQMAVQMAEQEAEQMAEEGLLGEEAEEETAAEAEEVSENLEEDTEEPELEEDTPESEEAQPEPSEETEDIEEPEIESAETEDFEEPEAELEKQSDDTKEPESPDAAALMNERQVAQDELKRLQDEAIEIKETLQRFEQEILPFCYFSMYSIYHELQDNEAEKAQMLEILEEGFPQNMYTRAALALENGLTPRLVDPALEAAEDAFDLSLGYYPEYPDSLVSVMQEFTLSEYPELKLRANYRLGWYYSFEEPDTTLAKSYLEAVLAESEAADYGTTVRRFFDGSKYLLRDSGLPDSTSVLNDIEAEDAPEPLEEEMEISAEEPEAAKELWDEPDADFEAEPEEQKPEALAEDEADSEPEEAAPDAETEQEAEPENPESGAEIAPELSPKPEPDGVYEDD